MIHLCVLVLQPLPRQPCGICKSTWAKAGRCLWIKCLPCVREVTHLIHQTPCKRCSVGCMYDHVEACVCNHKGPKARGKVGTGESWKLTVREPGYAVGTGSSEQQRSFQTRWKARWSSGFYTCTVACTYPQSYLHTHDAHMHIYLNHMGQAYTRNIRNMLIWIKGSGKGEQLP